MNSIEFNKLDSITLVEGAQLCLENTENHLKIAETIKDSNLSIGYSISHLILATEECVKGIVYVLRLELGLTIKVPILTSIASNNP